jgi:phenylacetate-CoA ligase
VNPLFPFYLIKGYFFDVERLRESEEKIEKYRQKCFRKVLKLAMKTPLYKEKYKGIDVNKITLDNIEKLPILTKQDLRKHFPNGIVPEGFNVKKAHIVSTSGSTGQPVSVYTDFHTIVKALMAFVREIKEHNISWRDRMTIIADLTPRAIEEAYLVKGLPFKFRNMQILHVGEDVEKLIEKINSFNPKFIGGYPGVLRALAVLKRKGYGKNIEPEVIASSGAVLDEYTKKYIEEAFNARVFDVYGSTEGGPIAFECKKGNYHIHYDMVHVEFLDDNLQPVEYGKPGHIVVTKLYGSATPIIRYNGLNDFVIPLAKKCNCGINAPLIEKIGGRTTDALVLPSGKIVPPLSITGIPAKVMERLNSFIVQQFQIIQEEPDEINVYLVMEDGATEKKRVMEEIKKEFEKKLKENVKINVFEVDEIKSDTLIPKVVVSKVSIG